MTRRFVRGLFIHRVSEGEGHSVLLHVCMKRTVSPLTTRYRTLPPDYIATISRRGETGPGWSVMRNFDGGLVPHFTVIHGQVGGGGGSLHLPIYGVVERSSTTVVRCDPTADIAVSRVPRTAICYLCAADDMKIPGKV